MRSTAEMRTGKYTHSHLVAAAVARRRQVNKARTQSETDRHSSLTSSWRTVASWLQFKALDVRRPSTRPPRQLTVRLSSRSNPRLQSLIGAIWSDARLSSAGASNIRVLVLQLDLQELLACATSDCVNPLTRRSTRGHRTQWPVCLCVCACVSVGHVHEPCKNGWTDRDVVWGGRGLNQVGPTMGVKFGLIHSLRDGWQDSNVAFRQNFWLFVADIYRCQTVYRLCSASGDELFARRRRYKPTAVSCAFKASRGF